MARQLNPIKRGDKTYYYPFANKKYYAVIHNTRQKVWEMNLSRPLAEYLGIKQIYREGMKKELTKKLRRLIKGI